MKTITMTCPDCAGTGENQSPVDGRFVSARGSCARCNGRGMLVDPAARISYSNSKPMRLCDTCLGSGVVESAGGTAFLLGGPCPDCGGTGQPRTEKEPLVTLAAKESLVALAVAAEDALKNLAQAATPYLDNKTASWLRCAIGDTGAVRGRITALKEI